MSVSPLSLDVSSGIGTVAVRAHVVDNLSGFKDGWVGFTNGLAGNSYYAQLGDWNRVSGNALDGWYEMNMSIAQYSAQGLYSISGANLRDATNNYDYLTPEGLAQFGNGFFIGSSDVPEPETYALILAGLGLLGVFSRRRKAMQP